MSDNIANPAPSSAKPGSKDDTRHTCPAQDRLDAVLDALIKRTQERDEALRTVTVLRRGERADRDPLPGCACCPCLGRLHRESECCFIEHRHGCDGRHGKLQTCNTNATKEDA